MKKLNPFSGNTGLFLDNIILAKRNSINDPTYRNRITLLSPNVKVKFLEFDREHISNSLPILTNHGYVGRDKDDLLKLYKYKSKLLQKLKKDITTTESNRLINTCQNCTINEINSFDHIVPKDEFPEFAVNPKNLFPSCTMCNGYKSINWRENGSSLFLNLYLDPLPSEQYLFAEPLFEDGIVTAKFMVLNTNNIDHNLFNLINNHYYKLHLPERFRINSHDTIFEVIKEINNYKDKMTRESLVSTIRESIIKDKNHYGHNFWKTILKEALINSDEFMDQLFSE